MEPVPMPMIEAVVETAVDAEDLGPIERFYTEILGLPLIGEVPDKCPVRGSPKSKFKEVA